MRNFFLLILAVFSGLQNISAQVRIIDEVVAVVGDKRILYSDVEQNYLQQKAGVGITQAIVLETPVEAIHVSLCILRQHFPWCDKDPDGDRHFLAGDEIVKHSWRFPLDAVLVDIHASWLVFVLSRDVQADLACGAGIKFGLVEGEF